GRAARRVRHHHLDGALRIGGMRRAQAQDRRRGEARRERRRVPDEAAARGGGSGHRLSLGNSIGGGGPRPFLSAAPIMSGAVLPARMILPWPTKPCGTSE